MFLLLFAHSHPRPTPLPPTNFFKCNILGGVFFLFYILSGSPCSAVASGEAQGLLAVLCGGGGVLPVSLLGLFCLLLHWRADFSIPHSLFLLLVFVSVAQSCLTLCSPMDYSLPGSAVHGIFQARVLEWVAFSCSRGSSRLTVFVSIFST